MIITRTPLRISLGGGGTDLPSYYVNHGPGFLVGAAISKYVYIAVNRNFDDDILLKYSQVERVAKPRDVRHPLLRECLIATNTGPGIEISSMADIPTGTGLGSSGAFTVGVLKALRAHSHEAVSNADLAALACEIEMERLGEPVGKQDQYMAALGGITMLTFHADGRVEHSPIMLDPVARSLMEDNLLLFYTGVRRSASEVLADEQAGRPSGFASLKANMDDVRAIGYETAEALREADLARFGRLLTEQWRLKHARQPSGTHDRVDLWITEGIAAGALGGKLVGAGGGGFLLFYAEDKGGLREVMQRHGLEEVRFHIDYDGSTTLVSR